MNKKEFFELVENNYSYVEYDGELSSSNVKELAIYLLCEKIWNINMETTSFFMYYKYLDNVIGIGSYVVFLNDKILYIEIVDDDIMCVTTDYDDIVKNVKYIIKESGSEYEKK